MSFLGNIPFVKKVPPGIKSMRIGICQACPHLKSGKTCGTFLFGGTVLHNGFPVNLCGCIVNEKTELPGERCPLAKWLEYNQ